MTGRAVRVGLAIVVLYVVSVAVTGALKPGQSRPLYDAFVPPSSYRWVKPPPFFASNNVRPKAASREISLTSTGSVGAGFAPSDGQFVVDLAAGAVAPHADATSVSLRVTPLDATKLAPLPGGMRADGNAYRVDMTYVPGGASTGDIARAGSLLVEIPELGTALFRSVDGVHWTALDAHAVGASRLTLAADFQGPGVYVAGTTLPELQVGTHGSGSGTIVVGVITAIVAVLALAIAFARQRTRAKRNVAAP